MDKLRTGVLVLFVFVVPVSCTEGFFTDPVICYFLDGFLVVYCVIATALYFREKFSYAQTEVSEDKGGIYQELERPKDADPYQELQPVKKKKKPGKKKKSQAGQPDEDKDPYESLSPGSPPLP